MAETGTAVIKRTDADVKADIAMIFEGIDIPIEDSDDAQRAIVEQILGAQTLGDVFATRTTIATRNIIDQPIVINDFRLREGEIEDKKGAYMIIDAADRRTGEAMMLNTSSKNIMAALLWCKHWGVLPVEVSVYRAGRARRGGSPPLALKPEGKTLAAIEQANKAK